MGQREGEHLLKTKEIILKNQLHDNDVNTFLADVERCSDDASFEPAWEPSDGILEVQLCDEATYEKLSDHHWTGMITDDSDVDQFLDTYFSDDEEEFLGMNEDIDAFLADYWQDDWVTGTRCRTLWRPRPWMLRHWSSSTST